MSQAEDDRQDLNTEMRASDFVAKLPIFELVSAHIRVLGSDPGFAPELTHALLVELLRLRTDLGLRTAHPALLSGMVGNRREAVDDSRRFCVFRSFSRLFVPPQREGRGKGAK